MHSNRLSQLPIGKTGRIGSLCVHGPLRRRLLDMGLTPHVPVTCLYRSALGNMRAYLIRGTVIALRSEVAAAIEIL